MTSGINNNRFFKSYKNRRVDPIEETNYRENFDKETIIIDVEYEDLTNNRDKDEIICVKEELILYNKKGKIVKHVRSYHNINKTT